MSQGPSQALDFWNARKWFKTDGDRVIGRYNGIATGGDNTKNGRMEVKRKKASFQPQNQIAVRQMPRSRLKSQCTLPCLCSILLSDRDYILPPMPFYFETNMNVIYGIYYLLSACKFVSQQSEFRYRHPNKSRGSRLYKTHNFHCFPHSSRPTSLSAAPFSCACSVNTRSPPSMTQLDDPDNTSGARLDTPMLAPPSGIATQTQNRLADHSRRPMQTNPRLVSRLH